MAELFEYLGLGIGFFTLLALIELTLFIVFIVLVLRYLFCVPKVLEKISDRLEALDENMFALYNAKVDELHVFEEIGCSLDDMANTFSRYDIDN